MAELTNDYQLYSQKKNEAEIADAMDQQQLVNVAVAERPTFAAKPYSPRVLLNLALGLFTAIFLGSAVVFFAELGRETIAAPYELEAISAAPVLATVPFGPPVFIPRAAPYSPGGGLGRARRVAESHAPEPVAAVVAAPVAPVAAPDSADAIAVASDEGDMRIFRKNSVPPAAIDVSPVESTAVLIHPARPAPARSYEQLSSARIEQGRAGRGPAAPVREPRAYPASPPRPEGAVQRSYIVEPAPEPAADSRHRAPLSLRASSLRSSLSPLQRAQRAREDQRRGQKSGEDV